MSRTGWKTALALAVLFLGTSGALAQSPPAVFDMNGKPDLAALGFQDDLTTLEECQTGCKSVIGHMLAKYKTDPKFGGNAKLGSDDTTQLGAALGVSAATLSKGDASDVQAKVAADLGPEAATAFDNAYAAVTAPYDPPK
jgi:hypothetical protein